MDIANLLKPLSKADIFARPSSAVTSGARRLEAGFYGSEGYRALRAMENSGFEVGRVKDIARVRWFGPFARDYVEDEEAGTPFLTSSTMMSAKLERKKFISKLTRDLERLMISDGTILVSCSGTIGNVALCTKEYSGWALSQDAIRVDPCHQLDRGILYAFLLSDLGQFLVTRNKSGSVVEHLYANDIESLPVPRLPIELRRKLSECIERSSERRTKANALMDEAEASVQTECALPSVQQFEATAPRSHLTQVKTFVCSSADRLNVFGGFGVARLDATYHDPTAVALANYILSRKDGTTLGAVVKGVINSTLRKRNYVDDLADGVPMLGGKQITQWRPSEIKYLSKTMTRNLGKEIVEKGWTLVSCGGTLGRTLFVNRNLEGSAVSQDVMRVIPDSKKLWPGFVFAFLTSDYGQIQLLQRGYGSVIPRLRDFQFNSIAIVTPPDKGKGIHDLVVAAYDARAEAKGAEDEAISLFMSAIERGREATEQHWGRDY
jgi:type I restriction enzyme S subunit